MTRLVVVADIHGNMAALEAVVADMAQFDYDGVVVAGDSVNWGPSSAEVFDFITAQGWPAIRGNNELYALDFDTPRAPDKWSHYALPPFLIQQLGPDRLHRIAAMPDEISLRFRDAASLRIMHGLPNNPWSAVIPTTPDDEVQHLFAPITETTIISGHSHIALDRHVDRWHIINPGSVGVPLDGDCTASYMLIEGDFGGWRVIEQRRIPFDHDALFAAFAAVDYEKHTGFTGRLVIEEFRRGRLVLYPFWGWRDTHYPAAPITDAMVDEYLQSDIRAVTPEPYRSLNY